MNKQTHTHLLGIKITMKVENILALMTLIMPCFVTIKVHQVLTVMMVCIQLDDHTQKQLEEFKRHQLEECQQWSKEQTKSKKRERAKALKSQLMPLLLQLLLCQKLKGQNTKKDKKDMRLLLKRKNGPSFKSNGVS